MGKTKQKTQASGICKTTPKGLNLCQEEKRKYSAEGSFEEMSENFLNLVKKHKPTDSKKLSKSQTR